MKRSLIIGLRLGCAILVGAGMLLDYRCRVVPRRETRICQQNQTQLDGSAEAYAWWYSVSADTRVPVEETIFALKEFAGMLPRCPSGGTYVPFRIGENPACSIHGCLIQHAAPRLEGITDSDIRHWHEWLEKTITPQERELGRCMRQMPIWPREAAGTESQPPYEKGMPGYLVLARRCHADGQCHVNCVHGAPGATVGGWQMVNASRDQWHALTREWHKGWTNSTSCAPDPVWPGVPFLWCGRATGAGRRVLVTLREGKGGQEWVTHHLLVAEADLAMRIARLNDLLKSLGEVPVTVDLPAHVDSPTGTVK